MKKLCLIVLPVIAVLFAGTYALITDAQTTSSKVDIGRAGTTMSELAAPSDYTQQARFSVTPSNGLGGGPVAMSGNTAVVYSEAGYYVFVRSGDVWSQQAILVPSDGLAVFGPFFRAVGIDGDTIVMGGAAATINGNVNQGAAYVFVRNGTGWTEQQRLSASDGVANNQFGISVAISGGTIIVGVPEAAVGGAVEQGAAYVFVRNGSSWSEQAKLLADDGGARNNFGLVVAINGDSAVVTRALRSQATIVNPAAYVFVRNGTTWSQQQKLSVCEPSGNDLCEFGNSISIDGDNLAVGNYLLNVGSNRSQGGVYVFIRSGISWSQQQRLTASDGGADGLFGSAVSIANNTLLVGAKADGVPGSAYIYARTGISWTQKQKLQVNVTRDGFGQYASMSGNTLLIACPLDIGPPGPNAISAAYVFTSGTVVPPIRSPFDFDGDGKTDISIFRPAPGEWWYLKSSNGGNAAAQFGASTDTITPGDFTGDGKADFAFWRPSTGFWFILRSEDFSFYAFPFGATGDIPAPADYDGDGKTDAAVFRPSTSTWFILRSSDGGITFFTFGASGDMPVAADYDGDGKADIAIYRPGPSEWWIQRSTAGLIAFQFGATGDKAVPGDYTGDGKADVAFWRPTTGEWFVLRSENQSYYSFPFGTTGDVPAPGDYDGDGKTDATVFRPSNSTWFANRSSSTVLIQPFGQAGDLPVPNAFVR